MSLISVLLETKEVNEYASGITAAEVISDIHGRKHGCVAAIIDGVERDLSFELSTDCEISGIKADSEEGMHVLRHSCAHLLAQAVTELFPNAKPTIGPAIENGFYYDFSMENIGDDELKLIEKKMGEICRKNLNIQRFEYTEDELKEIFKEI